MWWLIHLHLFPNGDAILDLRLFIAVSILNAVCWSSMSHQLQARFASSSSVLRPQRSNLCQDNIVFLLHQSWKQQHRQTYIPPTISSHIDHLVPSQFSPTSDRALPTNRFKLYEASCQSKNHLFFTVGNVKSYLTPFFYPHHSQIFSSFPTIENKISEST